MHKRKFLLVGILLVAMLVTVGVTGCTADQLTALEGVIQNIDTVSGNVTVKMKDGSTQTFNFADVKAETIKQALGSLSIEPGDKVTIKEDKNGEVKEIESKNAEIDGIIKSLSADSLTIATEKRGDITLEVVPETVIRIEDEGAVAFADLQVGQQVEAKYDVTSLKALKIKIDNDEEEGEAEGIITAIDTDNQTVTITTEEEGDIVLRVTSDTKIKIENKGTAAFAGLTVGRQVEAEYDESSMDALKIKVDDDDGDTDEEDEEDKEDEDINENNDENNFEIKGTIESISSDGNSIVVNGQTIIIQGAEIEGILTVGATVEAEVTAQPDGSLIAQEIEVEDDDNDDEKDEDDD